VRVLLAHSDDRQFEIARFDAAWRRAGGNGDELVSITPATAAATLGNGLDADGVLLTGGPDVEPWRYGREPLAGADLRPDRARDALDLELLAHADARGWPVLAVCYGCQILTVARGGELIQDLDMAGKPGHRVLEPKDFLAHTVSRSPSSRLLRTLPPEFAVNTRHHQAVLRPGDRLRVVATAPDGVIEALEGVEEDRFVLAVQWHPEHIAGGPHDEVFRLFREACEGAPHRRPPLGGRG
jgi:putative glutamine amidotransferase